MSDATLTSRDEKRKRAIIESDFLPDEVRDAASKLAAFAKAKAEHDKTLKELARSMLGDSTEDVLKTVIKDYCQANRSVEDIRAVSENVLVKSVMSKSTQSNLNEASVLKLISTCVDATAEMRREKQMQRLYDDNGLDRDAAGDLLDEMNTIDKVELLKRANQELNKMKTVTERCAIYYQF